MALRDGLQQMLKLKMEDVKVNKLTGHIILKVRKLSQSNLVLMPQLISLFSRVGIKPRSNDILKIDGFELRRRPCTSDNSEVRCGGHRDT